VVSHTRDAITVVRPRSDWKRHDTIMPMRRHQNDTKTFEELTFKEQALAMNAAAAQYRKMIDANLRRAEADGRSVARVRQTRLGLLERIIADYSS